MSPRGIRFANLGSVILILDEERQIGRHHRKYLCRQMKGDDMGQVCSCLVRNIVDYVDCRPGLHWMWISILQQCHPWYVPGVWNMRHHYLCHGGNNTTRIKGAKFLYLGAFHGQA